MKKVFYIKRTEQEQTYKLNLTYFSTDTDYKYILNLLSGGKHKNFINDMLTQCIAYDILYSYLCTRKSLHKSEDEYCFTLYKEDEYCFTLYKSIVKEIGTGGYLMFISELNKYIDDVFLIKDRPQKLNNFKI